MSPPPAGHQQRVPERHGFTVRKKRRSSCAPLTAHEVHLALRLPCAPDALTSTASRPASVTIAIRPSSGTRRFGYASDLGQARREIFLQKGLDKPFRKTRSDLPVGQICWIHSVILVTLQQANRHCERYRVGDRHCEDRSAEAIHCRCSS